MFTPPCLAREIIPSIIITWDGVKNKGRERMKKQEEYFGMAYSA